MAVKIANVYIGGSKVKRPGVHSKNASKGQKRHKKTYRGQGR